MIGGGGGLHSIIDLLKSACMGFTLQLLVMIFIQDSKSQCRGEGSNSEVWPLIS